MSYGASQDDWLNLDLALGLTADLLPVVSNPSAPISPKSSLKQLGKVPSLYNRGRQIAGIPNWTQHQATPKDIAHWLKEPDYGICLITRNVRALDIDVSDPSIVQDITEFIGGHLHWLGLPIRSRANSSKCLLAFRLAGSYPKRVMKVEGGIIEFLGESQQFVAFGTHPSGSRYEWDWQNHSDFPELSPEQFESLWQALADRFALEPPSQGGLRNGLSGDGVIAALNDPVAAYLGEHGHITSIGREGQVFVRCPFSDEHSEPAALDGTSTAYLPAGGRDYEQGHFRCLHAHCAHRDDADFLDAFGVRAADFHVIPPDAPELQDTPSPDTGRFTPIQAGAFSSGPEPEWLIEDTIPDADFGLIYGPSGSRKSFVAINMGFHIASGSPWNGKETRQGAVLYICAEGAHDFRIRLKAHARQFNIDLDQIPFYVIGDAPNLMLKEDISALLKAIKPLGPLAIIFIDTLAQTTAGGDENSGKDMMRALAHCKALKKHTGAVIAPVHHAGKDLAKGARGWSGLKAAADFEYECTDLGNNSSLLKCTKQKGGPTGVTWLVRANPITVGQNAKGKDISSIWLDFTERAGNPERAQGRKRSFIEQTLLDVIYEYNGELREFIVEEAIKRIPTDEKPKQKRYKASEAIKKLIMNEEIVFEAGVITIPL